MVWFMLIMYSSIENERVNRIHCHNIDMNIRMLDLITFAVDISATIEDFPEFLAVIR